jgi:membrane carboxypeptidase/penicillin-binding protein PbpC
LATGLKRDICPITEIYIDQKLQDEPCNNMPIRTVNNKTMFFIGDILANITARPNGMWRNNITVDDFNMSVKSGTSSVRIGNTLLPIDNYIVGYTPKTTILLWAGNTDGSPLKEKTFAVETIGPIWKEVAEIYYDKYPSSYAMFKKPEGVERINGEWASEQYQPREYAVLKNYIRDVPELRMNPLLTLQRENEEQ